MNHRERYKAFLALIREIHALEMADGWLSWDQQTYMPAKGAKARSLQLSTISGLRHKTLIGDEMKGHLEALVGAENELNGDALVNIREIRRQHERALHVPNELVREISRVQSLALGAWVEAREESDFSRFAPWLKEMLGLKRQEADAVGYTDCRYDALHGEYEQGSSARRVSEIFASLRKELVPLVKELLDSPAAATRKPIDGDFPIGAQGDFSARLLTAIGFDWEAGRVDVSAHPFCSGNVNDVRLTTRYDERNIAQAFFGLLHEGGHGLYEQGLSPEFEGTPRAQSVSLGIHESQSRMWENLVGRSRPFWQFALPIMKEFFPGVGNLTLDEWYKSVNRVDRSLIRVEADEVTYNLHIILRFELEMDLIDERLAVDDLPGAWNGKMQEFLGISPENDAQGCLQDIHWAYGILGYFPTYALGNLYASQFYRAAQKAIPNLASQYETGNFAPLLEWLRENIHRRGQALRPEELVKEVTGEELNARYQVAYLKEKFRALYDIA